MIIEKRVSEGQRVAAGDVLLVVASEHLMRSGAALETAIAVELEARRASLVAQIGNTRRLEVTEQSALKARRAAVAAEAASSTEAIAAKRRWFVMAERATQRYADLHERGFLSDEQLAMREAELLEQRSSVENLEREKAALDRLATEIDERIETLQPRYANLIAELERALASSELEIVENDARRVAIVTAPQPGTVTGLVADVGQSAPLGAVLARIVPNEPTLVAELFATSRAVGFVLAGDEVRLRYAAFPYQKFGHSRGTVVAVSATTVAGGDATRGGDPLYRVAVTLASQTVNAYGAPRRLLPGMAVEADVLLERRRLYEWVLEPLYALAGRVG
jgi:membrane fusion protein